jgi:nicotinamidase-related amidase
MARAGSRRRPLPVDGIALVLIDVINDLAFPGAEGLIDAAESMAPQLDDLRRRAARAGVPVIYVNDNFGQWRSDFRQTVRHCTSAASPGRRVSRRLRPGRRDFFVLKPKHSGFYGTTFDTLLESLGVDTLVLAGIAGNICVLFTANDAYMRGLKLIVVRDCVVSNTAVLNEAALEQMRIVLKAELRDAATISFRAGRRKRVTASARAVR